MLNNYEKSKTLKAFEFLHEHIIAIIIIIVVLAGTVSTFFIIEQNKEKKNNHEETNVEYVPADTVYFSMNKPDTLNPYASTSEDIYYVSQLIYSSLFKLDENLTPVPDLVENYSTDSSSGTVSIDLKSNVKFSDGLSLDAYDIRSSVNKIQQEGSKCSYYTYVSKINSIKVTGDYSLDIVFNSPDDAAIDNLVFPVVSDDSYDRSSNTVIGSGPYRYKDYDVHKSLYLVPNEYYYEGAPKNKVEVKVLPDKSTSITLMGIDAVTSYVMENQDADMVAEDMHLKETPMVSNEMEYLGFNFKNYVLSHKEMRQAIAYAIDIAAIIKDNYGEAGIMSDSIYFPGYLGTENKGDVYAYNQGTAIKLLNKMGYKDNNEDGILEDKDGKQLDFTILVNNNNKSRVDSAESISNSLRQIGVSSTVNSVSWEEYQNALKNGKYDMFLGGYKFDKQYNLKKLFEKDNVLSYNNIAVLNNINKMETALTAEEQQTVFKKTKDMLIEEIPYYCLCYKTYAFLTVERFKSPTVPTFFDHFRGCQDWEWHKAVSTEKKEDK